MGKKVTRLFEQFQPENYDLKLDPDPESMKFSGTVTIRGQKVGRPSQRITFHQKGLKINFATITKHDKKGDRELGLTRINNQDSFDEVRLHTEGMIYPGEYTVTMEFSGTITKPMNGIYPCIFKLDGVDKKLIATQFESHHAREALPCIDEPEAKATFDLTLISPAGKPAISNTPVKSESTTGDRLTTVFETTPRMSIYLLAFVFGEMTFAEATTKDDVLIRAYATPDKANLLDFGLQIAVRGLEFLSDYFELPYPLPKLDIVALPDFAVGAMENWGIMTFREQCMLADPGSSSIETKQLIAMVVSHELTHQWFGDLVTMKWWDDLWLNESFANMMEYRVVDELYPEWNIWEHFVAHETGSAKRRDSLADVQAIKSEVYHPDEINSLFDPSIVYAKGGTVLHMLMRYIGEDAFKTGLKAYFAKHAYGSTTADDLWEAMSASSQQDISAFMNGWLERPGFPLVDIDWIPGEGTLKLQQQRFLSDPAAKVADSQSWQVPLAATRELNVPLLITKSGQSEVAATNTPLLFNHDGASYFVPRYTQATHLQQIRDGIKADEVSAIDRLLLLDNYAMLQRGGMSATTDLLELLQGYQDEANESVWGSMAVALGEARKLIEGDDLSDTHLDKLAQSLVTQTAAKLGWDDQPNDDAQTLRLRGLSISLAAGAKTPSVLKEGTRRFAAFTQPSDLAASTRTVVYFIGARYGTAADFQKLLSLYHATNNADEREEITSALCTTYDPDQIDVLIKMFKTDDIRNQDLMHWYVWLLRNRHACAATWKWVTTEWDWIMDEFSGEKTFGSFARYPGSTFTTEAEQAQFIEFFDPKKEIIAMTRDIVLAEQEIASRVAWRVRNEDTVKAWLKKRFR
jgi:aminopeptidase N